MKKKKGKFGVFQKTVLVFSLALSTVVPVYADQTKEPQPVPVFDPLDPIIDNGTVQLGINPAGHLNAPGGTPSWGDGTTYVGLRYIPTNGESTAPGCLCEGWGVANADTSSGIFSGFANVDTDGGVNNLDVVESETKVTSTEGKTKDESQGSAFKSVVTTGEGRIKVTHDFKPSASPNLYEAIVTMENIGESTIGDLRYRRVMDWDIAPYTFDEHVEIHVGNASNVIKATTDGFLTANPLGNSIPSVGSPEATLTPGSADHISTSPSDQGSHFDFGFGELEPGAQKSFKIYYGASETRKEALSALSAVGAEVYSLGLPHDGTGNPAFDGPHVFVFGFSGVGGTTIPDPNKAPFINETDSTIVVNEGQTAVNTGIWSDENSEDTVNLSASLGNVTKVGTNEIGSWNWSFDAIDNLIQDVIITAHDGIANAQTSFNLVVKNVAPSIEKMNVPVTPKLVNTEVKTSADFTDQGILDTHTAVWNWGDGSTSSGVVTETDGSGSLTGQHVYTTPGVYTVTLTVTDKDGGSVTATSTVTIIEEVEDIIVVATAAAEKSKLAQNSIKAALSKINANSDKTLINEDIIKALAVNAEAKAKITRLIELFALYNNPKMPASQLALLRKQADIALQQNILVNTKLNEALKTNSLATAKALTNDALRANGYSLNYLEYIKTNLIVYKNK